MDLPSAFLQANPGLSAGKPFGKAGAGVEMGSAVRTVNAGGFLPDLLLHPVFTPFQYIFRRLPDEGLYQASRTRLYTIECGNFTVPTSMVLAVAEYRFQPYRQSGIAGDAVPLEDGRLPLSLGYDINFSQYRKGNLRAEILPTQATNQQRAFEGNGSLGGTIVGSTGLGASDVLQQVLLSVYDATPDAGSPSDPRSFLQNSTASDALLPQTTKGTQGPSRFPFSFVVESSQSVQLRITAFDALPIPLSFFETVVSGYLMPSNTYDEMVKGIRP